MVTHIQAAQIGTPRRASGGFTLVEILIVVLILGILAAIVIPQFTSAAEETRDNSLKMNLYRIRQQIEIYKQQHNGNPPTLASFEAQMTGASNVDGNTAAIGTDGYPFGPYITDIPSNAFTSGNTIGSGAVGDSDWYYDQTTGNFHANNSAEHRLY